MKRSANQVRRTKRHAQLGMTLIEALVAVFIFTGVFLTALMLYQAANRAYMQTDAATIQQQNIRFAMDRMTETLKDAGANYNPLGSAKLADEQVEGAWESAIFVRGDFDNAREGGPPVNPTSYESVTWPIVTTGNDEIVGFVLRKDGAGTIDLTVKLDVDVPRDAIYTNDTSITEEETKTIPVAAMTLADQTDPPYELTKVTFAADGTPQYEVIAENIFRLSFDYFPATGTTEVAASATVAALDTGRAARKTIRRIAVNLNGMTERPDFGYSDPVTYDPVEGEGSKAYRKLPLSQTLLAVNLGMKGKRHYYQPATEIISPEYIRACNGHCRRYLITWPQSITGGVQYELSISAPANVSPSLPIYDEDPITLAGLEYEFEEPIDDVTAGVYRNWTFKVRAITGIDEGEWTGTVTRIGNVNSQSIPSIVENVTASQASGVNAMQVDWDSVTENENPITDNTCLDSDGNTEDPPADWAISAEDLTNYKIYRIRSTDPNDADDATTEISTQEWGDLENASTTTSSFTDKTAAPGSSYFYRVKACDLCNVTSTDYSDPMTDVARFAGLAAGIAPDRPAEPTLNGSLTYAAGNYTLSLKWPHVTRTSDDVTPAATAHYVLERWRHLATDPTTDFTHEPAEDIDIYENNVSPTMTVPDTVGGIAASYQFKVRGVYDCSVAEGGSREGELSDPFTLGCTPPLTHTVEISAPGAGGTFVRPDDTAIPLQVTVGGLDEDWTSAKIQVKNDDDEVIHEQEIAGAPSSGVYDFTDYIVSGLLNGVYTVSASATTTLGCRGYAGDIAFELDTNVCGPVYDYSTDDLLLMSGVTRERELTFKLTNNCGASIVIDGMTLEWSGGRNTSAYITKIQYNSVDITATLTSTEGASGEFIPFTSNLTLPTGTSSFFKVFYSDRKDGTTWSSIQTRDFLSSEPTETLEAGPVTHSCAVIYDYSTDDLLPNSGGSRDRLYRFKVTNDCGTTVNLDGIKVAYTGGQTATAYIATVWYDDNANGTFESGEEITATLTSTQGASNTFIAFDETISVTGTTSNFFQIQFSDRKDGATVSSIIMRNADTQEQDEILGSGSLVIN